MQGEGTSKSILSIRFACHARALARLKLRLPGHHERTAGLSSAADTFSHCWHRRLVPIAAVSRCSKLSK